MDQVNLYRYYQETSPQTFDVQRGRLLWMFRQASRRYRKSYIHVLNIGIGNGLIEELCLQQGWIVHSVDIVPETVARIRATGVDAVVASIVDMPFDAGKMDVVFCGEVLEHLTAEVCSQGLDEIHRVLRTGGVLIGTTPHNEPLRNSMVFCDDCGKVFHQSGHLQSFTKARQREVLETHGFDVKRQYVSAFHAYHLQPWYGKIALLPFSLLGMFGRGFNFIVCGFVSSRVAD